MKPMRIERNRWIDPIDDFVRRYGRATPRWAVFLTYNIDLERFSRAVLPTLARHGRRFRTLVLTDHGTLEQSLHESQPQFRGAVNLHPVRCQRGGVFHPKLAFLRAGRHVRVCFGSANITDGGMGSNLELWTYTESAEIVKGIHHFLLALTQSRYIALDDGARRSLRRALAGLVGAESPAVWSSLQESFANRLKREPKAEVARVTIVSPMYAGDGAISTVRAAIRASDVRLYTDVPVAVSKCPVFIYSPPDLADQAEDDAERLPQTLHAKAYVFRPRVGKVASAWLGSANFTAQALAKPVSKGGNVELMIRTRLPQDEADDLEADLANLFKQCEEPISSVTRQDSRFPKAISTILACELEGRPGLYRLRIHATQRHGVVVLKNDRRSVKVTVRNGQGLLEGRALDRLLPNLDTAAADVLIIHQVLRGEEIPVVVNIPHVPRDDSNDTQSHASIDTLLEDLLGRIPINRTKDGSGEDEEVDGGNADDGHHTEDDDEADEIERRLDQVRHQGELDQLAVKIALLKKRAVQTTAAGAERTDMFNYIISVLRPVTPRHLYPAIRSLFDPKSAEST
jgi:hypothetical protein